jgi:flagellum-specific ATP synthase
MFEVLDHISATAAKTGKARPFGKVTGISGLVVAAHGLPEVAMGSRCIIENTQKEHCPAEVVGFENGQTLLMPFGAVEGLGPGCKVYPKQSGATVVANNSFVGRVVNALGIPVDGKGPLDMQGEALPLKRQAPSAGKRRPVGEKLDVGVRALNTFVPLCRGQRLGIFSGSGVGKSVLMSMLARYANADVNVIGLVGERGREVREFIEEQLGPEGLAKSVIVVATGDEPPLMRRQAAYLTLTLAEFFRDQGKDVMLLMDSVTRFAMAQREIGLSAGEPPTTRGFTPSVFAELPKLLERAGPGVDKGTITAIFTVLVEGGDLDEPIADAVRGILDGHIVMERALAERGHFPAIAVLKSVSRMVPECNSDEENMLINRARQLLATYGDMEELIRLGAYQRGSDAAVDEAITYYEPLTNFLKQKPAEQSTLAQGFGSLAQILAPLINKAKAAS